MKKLLMLGTMAGFLFVANNAFASNTYITINNSNNNNGIPYSGNIMCTEYGGICVNSNYIMSTRRTIYAPSQWKRPTLREKRRLSYEQQKAYYEY